MTTTQPMDDTPTRRDNRHIRLSGPAIGLTFIVIGAYFLLNRMGVLPWLSNWWALFFLLPAVGLFAEAHDRYRGNGEQWTARVYRPLVGGVLFVAATGVYLLEWNYSIVWPVVFIIAGLLVLIAPSLRRSS
jgi:hypothetical protein